MACNPLIEISKSCGKENAAGLRDDVYLISYDSLSNITGSTEVFSTSETGLISAINAGANKFVKVGSVKNSNGLTENFTMNDNGSFDIVKELTFSLSNVGSVSNKQGIEALIGNPVSVIVKMRNGQHLALGLNGQLQLSGITGEVNSGANGRTVTLNGSDTELIQVVDPTIVAALLA